MHIRVFFSGILHILGKISSNIYNCYITVHNINLCSVMSFVMPYTLQIVHAGNDAALVIGFYNIHFLINDKA